MVLPFKILVLVIASTVAALAEGRYDAFESVKKGIVEHFTTNGNSATLARAAKSYHLMHVFREHRSVVHRNSEVCEICNLAVDLAIKERRAGMSRDNFADLVEALCVTLNVEPPRVCHGAININIDFFLYVVDDVKDLTSQRVCGTLMQEFNCPGDTRDWSVKVPTGNSKVRPELEKPGAGSLQILQLSDVHIDHYYQYKGKVGCGEPICCQSDQGLAGAGEESCGYWSDYRSGDAPWYLIEESVRHAKTQKFDYVYWTGDIISHRIWETSKANNSDTISKLYELYQESFDVPIFPIFGNHEPHPLNVWPSIDAQNDRISIKWLLELAAKEWSKMIGQNVTETVLKGGYYSVSPKKGFRVVAINSNFCLSIFNWWLVYDNDDPFEQLQWLVDTLTKAEEADESVHILAHVPSGDNLCQKVWSREYNRIVERFANTITGQFNGHTHRDEFRVHYNKSQPTQPINVAFNGASVTPFVNSNPSYRLYKMDNTTFTLLDSDEWTFNLTLANSRSDPTKSPEWFRLYSFSQAYGVENLRATEIGKVVEKMTKDRALLHDYFRFFWRAGDEGIKGGCDDECLKSYLCSIVTTDSGDLTQCNYFTNLFDKQLL